MTAMPARDQSFDFTAGPLWTFGVWKCSEQSGPLRMRSN
jgi:hypothetical protein